METLFLLFYCLIIGLSSKRLKAQGCLYIAPLIPALVALGQAGYQMYQGQKQKKLAAGLSPSNYIPPSVQEAVAGARVGANASVMPGYDRVLDKLKTSSANTIARTSRITDNSGRIQQSVADADAREKEVIKDLGVNNEEFRLRNRDKLTELLGVQGGFEKASMDAYNQTKSALGGAAAQNQYNAITTLGENLIMGMSAGKKDGGIPTSIVGKTGDELTKTLADIQKTGRTLTPEELDHLGKLGLKKDTLSLAFPTLKFN